MCQLCLDGGAQTVGQTPRQTDTQLHRQISGRTDKHSKPALGQIRHSRKMTASQAVPLPTAFPLCFAFSQMSLAAHAKKSHCTREKHSPNDLVSSPKCGGAHVCFVSPLKK